jgi:hypothetical protein
MTALRVLAFDGLVPKLSPSLLGDNFAQRAENVKLYSGELRYWRGPVLDYSPPTIDARTIYKLYNSAGSSIWLLWNTDVDVAPGPVADATENRVYYTGSGAPKKTNYSMASSGVEPFPNATGEYQDLGVPTPTAAPSATVTTPGSGTAENRAYVFTYINTFGAVKEESKPSAAASVTVSPIGATITIGSFPALPVGALNITHRRIYRTVVGTTTVSYQFVAEIAVGTASYADSLTSAQLGEVLATIGWDPPPSTLAGLVALPTGTLAGFVGNTVYFSEPFFPHAWPLAYAVTLPANIVGLSVIGSSVVVMTDKSPYFIHGGIPGDMAVEEIQMVEPCLGKATIAKDEDGVIYASPNGLVGISTGARGLLTDKLFTAVEWAKLTPSTMRASVLEGHYFGVFPNEVPARAMILSRTESPALSFMELPAQALHVDARKALLYFFSTTDGKVYQLDGDENQPLSYEWRSKRWHADAAVTYSCLRLDADFNQLGDAAAYNAQIAAIQAYNAAAFSTLLLDAVNDIEMDAMEVNGSVLQNVPVFASARTSQVVIYGDGGAVVANVNMSSLNPVRLPSFRAREIEFAILGNINVRSIHMATTMDELRE